MDRITWDEYNKFFHDFWCFRDKYRHLRLGQAFLNEFFPNVSDSELFYCQDVALVTNIIFERYVDNYDHCKLLDM